MIKKNYSIFTAKEQSKYKKFAEQRTKFFTPILKILDKLHFTPNILTALSFIPIIGFIYYAPISLYAATIFIVLHILFDALDGSLARYQKTSSPRGALIDIINDHGWLTIAIIALVYYQMLDPLWATLYIIFYTVTITSIVLLNSKKHSPTFIIRSKWLFYILIPISATTTINIFDPFLTIFTIYYIAVSPYLLLKIISD